MLEGDRSIREHLKFAGQKGSIVEAALNVLLMWDFCWCFRSVNSELNRLANFWKIDKGWIDWEIENIAEHGFGRRELEDNKALQSAAKDLSNYKKFGKKI